MIDRIHVINFNTLGGYDRKAVVLCMELLAVTMTLIIMLINDSDKSAVVKNTRRTILTLLAPKKI